MVAGVLFGPRAGLAVVAPRSDARPEDGGRGASGTGSLWRRGHGLRRLLVVGEIALAVVLLVGAVLVVRSVARLAAVPPGFDPAGTLTFELTMQGQRYEKAPTAISPTASCGSGSRRCPASRRRARSPRCHSARCSRGAR